MLNLSILPKKIRKIESFWKEFPDAILAGGAVRALFDGSEVSDFDFFMQSKEKMREANVRLTELEEGEKLKVAYRCPNDNVYSVRFEGLVIQLIHVEDFETARELISVFDFTVAAAALTRTVDILPEGVQELDGEVEALDKSIQEGENIKPPEGISYYLTTHEQFLTHIIDRELHPAGERFNPTGAMLRLQKYGKRGYRATTSMLLAISRQIIELNGTEVIPDIWRRYADLGKWNPRVD